MPFDRPITWQQAKEALNGTPLPSALSSAELSALPLELRRRAFFSAQTESAWYLSTVRDGIRELVSPDTAADVTPDQPALMLRMREMLDLLDYQPDAADAGTLRDLSSYGRRKLIVDTQVRMAASYAHYQSATQNPLVVDLWPAWEFTRVEQRETPRLSWPRRWSDAGGDFFDGRMIAPKDSPVWARLSRFGLPHAPFDYSSGMGQVDVSREEAESLGVIQPDQVIEPDPLDLPAGLESSAADPDRDADLLAQVLQALGPDATLEDGVVKLREARA